MNNLVALDLPQTQTFADAIKEAWNNEDAVFVIDPRLSQTEKQKLLERFRPHTLIRSTSKEHLKHPVPVMSGDALLVATSGTTGQPNGAIFTFKSLMASRDLVHARLNVDIKNDHFLACIPLAHVGGLGVVVRSILSNVKFTILESPKRALIESVEDANIVSLVYSVLDQVDTEMWKAIFLGAMKTPDSLGPNIFTTYGLTETFGGVVYNNTPLEGVNVRIINGLIEIKSPSLLRSYRNNINGTIDEEGFDPKTKDGWFSTGDIGEFDANGKLRVLGRKDDSINTGGETFFPSVVENVIAQANIVKEIVISSVRDETYGERVVAVIVPFENKSVTLNDIKTLVASKLPSYMKPREIIEFESIPKTALGKIMRNEIKALIRSDPLTAQT